MNQPIQQIKPSSTARYSVQRHRPEASAPPAGAKRPCVHNPVSRCASPSRHLSERVFAYFWGEAKSRSATRGRRHAGGGPLKRLLQTGTIIFFLLILTPAHATPPPTIRTITIHGNTRTRTETITRELLFATGDSLNPTLLAETERNLRALLFLGNVHISTEIQPPHADLTSHVQDLYARALTPTLSGEPDELSYGLIALDYNFLGRGQTVQLTTEHDAITGNRAETYYRIPRIANSRHTLTTNLSLAEEGHNLWATLSHPFYALSTPWSYGLSLYSEEFVQRLYTSQTLSARYTDRLDGAGLWLTRSYGTQTKIRPGLSLDLTDHHFTSHPDFTYAPQNRTRVLPGLGLTLWRPRYETTRFVQDLGRTEDLQTGSWISLNSALSSKTLGSDRTFLFYQIQLVPRFKPTPNTYTFSSLTFSARQQQGGYTNLTTSASLRTYIRLRNIHTLALRFRWDTLTRSEDGSQFLLGSLRGLRGYAIRRFDGTRRFFFNLEARPTFYQHRLFVLAGSFFADGGTAWTPSLTSANLNFSAGFGGRLALTRVYNSPILRADLGYGFRDKTWLLTVGLGQYF